jgi:hypothetical protein
MSTGYIGGIYPCQTNFGVRLDTGFHQKFYLKFKVTIIKLKGQSNFITLGRINTTGGGG